MTRNSTALAADIRIKFKHYTYTLFVTLMVSVLCIALLFNQARAQIVSSTDGIQIQYAEDGNYESGLCPTPNIKGSCQCTKDEAIMLVWLPIAWAGLIPVLWGPVPIPIPRERCVTVPDAFGGEDNTSRSSTYAYPRVLLKNWLWGIGTSERYLGPGECSFVNGTARHCARITRGGEHGNILQGDTSGRSEEAEDIPTRLCVYEDNWDFMDTNGQFSPFHKNTSAADAAKIMETMQNNSLAGEAWMGSGSKVVSGWDSFWSFIAGGSYNYDVRKIVGCAPLPLSPMPPPYCDDCKVLPDVPDPRAFMTTNSRFERSEFSVTFSEYEFNAERQIYQLKQSENATMLVGDCKTHLDEEYCMEYCSQGEQICFMKKTNGSRLIQHFNRPGFMPLPIVEEDEPFDLDYPKMKVKFGEAPYEEEAILSVNEEGQECATLHGVELCADRQCEGWDLEAGVCDNRSSEICLLGYNPQPFDVEGYHPSKGVLVDVEQQNFAPLPYNSFNADNGMFYFDAEKFYTDPENSGNESFSLNEGQYTNNLSSAVTLPANFVHQPFTPKALGLCINGAWRWPETTTGAHVFNAAGEAAYSNPETVELDVDPSCTRVKARAWGGGAAGFWKAGCHSTLCDYSGGAGGYAEADFDIEPDDNIRVVIGRGSDLGAEGTSGNIAGDTVIKLNGTNIMVARGGVRITGGGATVMNNIRNIEVTHAQNGGSGVQTREAAAGGKPYNLPRQEASVCTSGTGKFGENKRAPAGAGGCTRDDNPGNGVYAMGGHGAASLRCIRFADDEATQPGINEDGEKIEAE